jgi:hypothetical protein
VKWDKMHVGKVNDDFSSIFCFINFKQDIVETYIFNQSNASWSLRLKQPRSKNDCAGEDQQQFIQLNDQNEELMRLKLWSTQVLEESLLLEAIRKQ